MLWQCTKVIKILSFFLLENSITAVLGSRLQIFLCPKVTTSYHKLSKIMVKFPLGRQATCSTSQRDNCSGERAGHVSLLLDHFSWGVTLTKRWGIYGWCGSVDWAPACRPKDCWLDSQSEHILGLPARSSGGGVREATDCCIYHTSCISLSFSLLSPLSKNK